LCPNGLGLKIAILNIQSHCVYDVLVISGGFAVQTDPTTTVDKTEHSATFGS